MNISFLFRQEAVASRIEATIGQALVREPRGQNLATTAALLILMLALVAASGPLLWRLFPVSAFLEYSNSPTRIPAQASGSMLEPVVPPRSLVNVGEVVSFSVTPRDELAGLAAGGVVVPAASANPHVAVVSPFKGIVDVGAANDQWVVRSSRIARHPLWARALLRAQVHCLIAAAVETGDLAEAESEHSRSMLQVRVELVLHPEGSDQKCEILFTLAETADVNAAPSESVSAAYRVTLLPSLSKLGIALLNHIRKKRFGTEP